MRTHYVLSGAAVLGALGLSAPAALAASAPSPSRLAMSSPAAANQLLIDAARTESAAYQQYYGYAAAADNSGYTALADVWRAVGRVEHQDHWTHEITLANLYSGSDNVANLRLAIKQAQQAATAYEGWAAMAPRTSAAADVLRRVADRETYAVTLLTRALHAVQGNGPMPVGPAVRQVQVRVSNPNYSGTFYNDLTGGSDSALEVAAWKWAEYQFDAKTAVDTGQANLAALLSRLEAQEAQNWTEISNVAGYVNSDAMNLQTSIASEQEAIDMYNQYATQARRLGSSSLGRVFDGIKTDEEGHHQAFATEFQQLTRRY